MTISAAVRTSFTSTFKAMGFLVLVSSSFRISVPPSFFLRDQGIINLVLKSLSEGNVYCKSFFNTSSVKVLHSLAENCCWVKVMGGTLKWWDTSREPMESDCFRLFDILVITLT